MGTGGFSWDRGVGGWLERTRPSFSSDGDRGQTHDPNQGFLFKASWSGFITCRTFILGNLWSFQSLLCVLPEQPHKWNIPFCILQRAAMQMCTVCKLHYSTDKQLVGVIHKEKRFLINPNIRLKRHSTCLLCLNMIAYFWWKTKNVSKLHKIQLTSYVCTVSCNTILSTEAITGFMIIND